MTRLARLRAYVDARRERRDFPRTLLDQQINAWDWVVYLLGNVRFRRRSGTS